MVAELEKQDAISKILYLARKDHKGTGSEIDLHRYRKMLYDLLLPEDEFIVNMSMIYDIVGVN